MIYPDALVSCLPRRFSIRPPYLGGVRLLYFLGAIIGFSLSSRSRTACISSQIQHFAYQMLKFLANQRISVVETLNSCILCDTSSLIVKSIGPKAKCMLLRYNKYRRLEKLHNDLDLILFYDVWRR